MADIGWWGGAMIISAIYLPLLALGALLFIVAALSGRAFRGRPVVVLDLLALVLVLACLPGLFLYAVPV